MTAFYSCEIHSILTSPGHSSAPDEALYWLKCVVGVGGLCITPIVSQATPLAEALYWLKCVVGIGFNLGEAYLKQNDYAAAEQAFGRAVAADTTSAQFRNGLGRSLYLRRDYAAAAAECSRAVRLDSLFARAHFNLGNALLRSGQQDEGRRHLALYKRLEEEEDRIAMLKNTLATHPDDAGAYHDLAVVYGQRGQYQEARLRYLQALDRDPAFAPAHHNLGNIHFRRGAIAAAEQRFRQALQADSTYVLSHLGLGNVYMLRKQYERAMASFRRGLRHQPNHPKLRRNLAAAEQIAAQVGR